MSKTKYYDLYVDNDSSTKFIDWRRQMNSGNDCNMTKIDEVLHGKADSSVSIELVLAADAWVENDGCYEQELTVDGLTAEHNGNIGISLSATAVERAVAREALMALTGQEDGLLTVTADGKLPEIDIPVTVTMIW